MCGAGPGGFNGTLQGRHLHNRGEEAWRLQRSWWGEGMVRRAHTPGRITLAGGLWSCTLAIASGHPGSYVGTAANGGPAPGLDAGSDSGSVIRGPGKAAAGHRRFRQSVGKPLFKGLSLSRLGMVRQNTERQVHDAS
jgi:hypothetical protein